MTVKRGSHFVVYLGLALTALSLLLQSSSIGLWVWYIGAVVTALVAKAMEQELFAFPLHPFITDSHAYLYGNLILILGLVVVASALLYFLSFGKKAPQPVNEPV
jgi:DHA2 family metal-tetracycline-proton antiporter-like MFS transporter